MEIIDNKALLFRTRSPDKYNVIPKHKIVSEEDGVYQIAVYWGLDEARVLKNLGVKGIQSPIVRRDKWPGRYIPMAHQIETSSFLTLHRRAFCFNDPGTGKTLSALWALDYLMQRGDIRRVLILCPLSIMHSAWMGDINNSIIHRSAVVAHHAVSSRRIEMIQENYEIVIANYDGLNLIASEIKNDGRFDLVIVDEGNAYKNTQTRRWKALASIIKPDTYLWMMTGTPASQSPVDAYGLARLVNPGGVPKFQTAWRDKVMNKISMFKWAPKADAKEQVFDALQPAIRFSKEQCLDLPPVITMTREVAMTAQQNKYYRLLKEQLMFHAAGATISAIVSHLEKQGIAVAQIHGDVSASKRGHIIHDFQTTPAVRVLVMQPQATAHGLTLTAADTVVFYGPLMSVEMYTQCIARADRKGQDSDKVTVVHIESSPIEKKLFLAMESKVTDHALLVGMFDNEVKNK